MVGLELFFRIFAYGLRLGLRPAGKVGNSPALIIYAPMLHTGLQDGRTSPCMSTGHTGCAEHEVAAVLGLAGHSTEEKPNKLKETPWVPAGQSRHQVVFPKVKEVAAQAPPPTYRVLRV